MLFEIDFNSDEAIYIQLHDQIITLIARHELKEGDFLPSVRTLAQNLGVNMHTVNKVYLLLRQEGYVRVDRRKRTYIALEVRNKEEELMKLQDQMHRMVAQAICNDISLEEMQAVIGQMYIRLQKDL